MSWRDFTRQLTGSGDTGVTVIINDESPPPGFVYIYQLISVEISTTATSDLEIGVYDGSKFIPFFRSNNVPANEITLVSDDKFVIQEHENLRVEWTGTADGDVLSVSVQGKRFENL